MMAPTTANAFCQLLVDMPMPAKVSSAQIVSLMASCRSMTHPAA
jgi:hypothetical protein